LLFVADPLESFRTYKDSTYAMMVQAQERGHWLYACDTPDLVALSSFAALTGRDGQSCRLAAHATRIELRRDASTVAAADDASSYDGWSGGSPAVRWFVRGGVELLALAGFDAIVMRKDPPFDLEYLYATHLLERAQAEGARVFNDPRALRDHNEKLAILEFAQYTAPTLVSRDPARLRGFVVEHGEAVLKLLDGMGGASIFRARADDPTLSVILETMHRFGTRTVMAQGFLPQIVDGDKRVLLIDGGVVPYCLARIPAAGESRGNLAAGGTGVARPLSARDHQIGTALAPVLAGRGLLLVGLDVIGDCLTEVNVTSPTCFREITLQTGFDVAQAFIAALERAVEGTVGVSAGTSAGTFAGTTAGTTAGTSTGAPAGLP
jgi:glutathione synthase